MTGDTMTGEPDRNLPEVVRMANQIADYFAAYPEPEAIEGVAGHIAMFWEARQRRALDEIVGQGGAGLNELVMAAMKDQKTV
jgi:formate dehydrogenase subunit delta